MADRSRRRLLRPALRGFLAVLLRLHQYAAFIPKRYPAALATINGTGMVAPTL